MHSRKDEILSGNKQAFRDFYDHTQKALFGYIYSRVKNKEDAQELMQDAYLSFLDSLPRFRGGSSLKTFLYSIVRHEIADYWRKKYAKKAVLMIPFMDQVYTERLYSSAVLNDEISRVYEKLNANQVIVLKLKYEQGYSVKQMAKILSLTVKSCESRLFRARKAFQKAYLSMNE